MKGDTIWCEQSVSGLGFLCSTQPFCAGSLMMKMILFLFCCLWASPGLAQAPVESLPKFEIVGDQVRARNSGTSQIIWQNTYPSVRLEKGEAMFPIVGPLMRDNQLFYAVRGELFAVDPLSGVVEKRHIYPAIIENLTATDAGMDLVLRPDADKKTQMQIAYHPNARIGPPMPNFLWVPGRAIYDSNQGRGLFDVIGLKGKDRDEEVQRILNDEKRDPTNPYLPLLRGILSGPNGPTAASNAAIERAITMPVSWVEKLQMAQILDYVGRTEMSDKLYAAAQQDLRDNGGDFESIISNISLVYVSILMDSIKEAVESGDLERTDFLANRLFEIYPSIEFRGTTWMDLSHWFAAQGNETLAQKWALRGKEAFFQDRTSRDAAIADIWLHIWSMVPLVLLLMALWIGVRPSFPKPTKTEIAVFAVFIVVGCVASFLAVRQVEILGFLNEQPEDFSLGATSSPDALRWLESLTPSPERDVLISKAKEAQSHLGTDVAPEALDRQRLEVARVQTATTRTWKKMGQKVQEVILTTGRSTGLALWIVLAMILGVVMRKRSDKARRRFVLLIPGSHCGPFAPLVQSLFVLGMLVWTFGSILEVSLTGSFSRFLGLTEGKYLLPRTEIGLTLIGFALLIHLATSVYVWRRQPQGGNIRTSF